MFRLDELRHRLIPLYSYDPTEDQEWGDTGNEDAQLAVSEPPKICSTSSSILEITISLINNVFVFPGAFVQRGAAFTLTGLRNMSRKERRKGPFHLCCKGRK